MKNLRIFYWRCSFSPLRIISVRAKHSKAASSPSQNFIDGRRCSPVDVSQTFENIDPSNGTVMGQFFGSGPNEVEKALKSCQEAFDVWSEFSASDRSSVLRRAARLIQDNIHSIAKTETMDTGKTLTESTFDVEAVVESCNYFAGLCHTLTGQYIPLHNSSFAYTRREPLGLCVGIGAWNFPFGNIAWKALPALACGNTMIYKPSPLTPLTSVIFAEILSDVGLPCGALNIVQGGSDVGQLLCTHPAVAKVSFTGSVETGSKVMAACARGIKKVTLELGGKSPLVIFEDADIANAVQGAMMANFVTQGEVCSNACRVYVHEAIYDEFSERLLNAVKRLRVGDPMDGRTEIGALISADHLAKVEAFISRAKAEGANVLYGGNRPEFGDSSISGGYYLNPCVMDNCHDGMEIVREEHFGPILCLLKFSSEDEVLLRANNTRYGLAGGVFTRDISRAHRFMAKLQAGTCYINTYNVYPVQVPFGGYKMSGLGRENGTAVLDNYSQIKSVYVEMNDVGSLFS